MRPVLPRGLADVLVATSSICELDARAGRLSYRGYDVVELAGQASFDEVVHLLVQGSLPDAEALAATGRQLARGGRLGPATAGLAASLPPGPLLERLAASVAVAGHEDPERDDPSARALRAVGCVVAVLTTPAGDRTVPISAAAGGSPALGDGGVARELLRALAGAEPAAEEVAGLDALLVLLADGGLSAAAFTARACALTLPDVYAALAAGLAALAGPLHATDPADVLRLLDGEAEPAQVAAAVVAGEQVPGFGPSRFRDEDPRVARLQALTDGLPRGRQAAERAERIAEAVVDEAARFPDLSWAVALAARRLGLPDAAATTLPAVARAAGLAAHVLEQQQDNRFVRPYLGYAGARDARWVPLGRR